METPPENPEPELKKPFSWKVLFALVGAWIAVMGLAINFQVRAFFWLLPVIAVVATGYIVVCTVRMMKKRG